jgi:hypothetical protein
MCLVADEDYQVMFTAFTTFSEVVGLIDSRLIVDVLLPRAKILAYDTEIEENRFRSLVVGDD